jgi:uncharacterized protein YutE (UPF0331/DUF86 family)
LNIVEGIDAGSPKACMRASRDVGLLDDAMTERALRMADDRNLTVHMYNEALAAAVYARLSDHAETLRSWLGAVGKGLAAS